MKYNSLSFYCFYVFSLPAFAQGYTFLMQDYPPFAYQEGTGPNSYKGACVEVNQAICDQLKMNCSFEVSSFARVLLRIKENEFEGGACMTYDPEANPERLAYMVVTDRFLMTHNAYMGLKNKIKPIDKIEDLSGWTVGTVRGSFSLQMANSVAAKVKNLNVMLDVNINQVLEKLKNNRYGPSDKSAVIFSTGVINYYAEKLGMELAPVFVNPKPQVYAISFNKKVDPKILDSFNGIIREMKKSGALKKIAQKYEKYDVSVLD